MSSRLTHPYFSHLVKIDEFDIRATHQPLDLDAKPFIYDGACVLFGVFCRFFLFAFCFAILQICTSYYDIDMDRCNIRCQSNVSGVFEMVMHVTHNTKN